jgi:cell wall-associated NlpC family hydrolase
MTDEQRRARRHGRATRQVTWTAILGAAAATAAAAAFATPAYADPPMPNLVPDSGARPIPAGALALPGAGLTPAFPATAPTMPALVTGPLASRIYNAETEVAQLGEQLLGLLQQRDQAAADLKVAEDNLRLMRDALAQAQGNADSAAADALKAAAAMPPGALDPDLQDLDALSRLMRGSTPGPRTDSAAAELEQAQTAEQNANSYHQAMQSKYDEVVKQVSTLETTRKTKETALLKLKQDNAAALAVIERAREAAEQRLGAGYISGESITGKNANPRALAAVRYALAQLGDPYLWAAEGPDRFDCSGLMWAAYRSPGAGYTLPRVSRDQYQATAGKTVDRSALLPGDLLFFASGPSWTSIHHVGMYLGSGRMVHAPTSGDVVKVSTVWWSRFFAATRVFGAVNAPTTPAPKPTTPTPSPTKNPTPSPTPTKPPTKPPTATPTTPTPKPEPTTPTPAPEPTTTTPAPDPTGVTSPDATSTTSPVAPETPSDSPASTEQQPSATSSSRTAEASESVAAPTASTGS